MGTVGNKLGWIGPGRANYEQHKNECSKLSGDQDAGTARTTCQTALNNAKTTYDKNKEADKSKADAALNTAVDAAVSKAGDAQNALQIRKKNRSEQSEVMSKYTKYATASNGSKRSEIDNICTAGLDNPTVSAKAAQDAKKERFRAD